VAAGCALVAFTAPGAGQGGSRAPFPAQFRDPAIFTSAIADAARKPLTPRKLSGLTVPHHLLAADLIAQGFRMADTRTIEKVIVLFPDHNKRSTRPFASTSRAFDTVFGRIEVDQADVRLLLQSRRLVEDSDLFGSDHGIGAILPFIKHHLPSARIVPVAVSYGSRKQDLDALAERLKRIAGPTTLIVQSTDFSHYLPQNEAVRRDQEVLNILAAGRLDAVPRLRQPQHTDSRGSVYLQMRLQREIFRARPLVVFNANSQAYAGGRGAQTTSYIVQLYEPQPAQRVGADAPGSTVYCFAGDTLFGRDVLRFLGNRTESERIRRELQHVLNGCRLVVNLTGVMVPEMPVNLQKMTLAMPQPLTLEWLRALNVVAVDLANNHTMDLGPAAFEAMAQALSEAGFTVLRHGSIVDIGPFRLAALTDLDNFTRRNEGMIEDRDIARLAASNARPPLFGMINWAPDYQAAAGPRERALMDALRKAAVSLIVGVHPHLAAPDFDLIGGGEGLSIYSLGNFLFDQSSQRSSGAVLEVRMFEQGTYFARLVPIPNVLEGGGSKTEPY
jgi:poly-gamma-glutamate synthesis protein (capsule biosynthesis protein)